MFAIYNKGSVGFRSTADNLYNLKNVEEAAKVELRPYEGFIQDFSNNNDEKEKRKLNENAISKYKQMANIDISEPVYHVQDIMSKDCISIDLKSTLKDAYDSLTENKVGQMPIVSFGKKIIGMINKKMILNLLIEDIENVKFTLNKKLEELSLSELITADPISDIRRVAKVMIDFKLDAIPIVDEDDILVGIISKTDIIKAISHIPRLQLRS
jgi:acetoin utilization protein AcuB